MKEKKKVLHPGTQQGGGGGGELCGKGSFHIQPRMCGTLEFSDPVRVFNSTKQFYIRYI